MSYIQFVLSVNYRLGIGYGHDFHRPKNAGAQGASEYLDVKAAGEYLRSLPQVDPKRIGIYGGSYGGYLTALALARDSQLFAAGVDIHGVHNWTAERAQSLLENRYEKPPDTAAGTRPTQHWRGSRPESLRSRPGSRPYSSFTATTTATSASAKLPTWCGVWKRPATPSTNS